MALNKIENLQDLIKYSINGNVVDQNVTILLPPGENFGSVMYKVDFKVKTEEKEEIIHAVAKCTPPNKVTQELFNTQITFKSEMGWYTTVIPTIQQFQRDSGVENVADFFQKFYGARISLDPDSDVVDNNGVILTQNLNTLGYKNIDRHEGFDLKTSKAVIRDLATFHAVPIAIKLKNPEVFEEKIRPFIPKIESKDNHDENKDPFNLLLPQIGEIPECAAFMDRLTANIHNNNSFPTSFKVREPWGSICHNDLWINNIMVKEGDITKTMILDLQVPNYASVAVDLVFFLLTSVNTEIVKEHMDELVQYYYDEFINNLERLKVDTSLFLYQEFLGELEFEAKNGQLGHALFLTYIIMEEKGFTLFDSSDENFKHDDLDKLVTRLNDRHKKKYKWMLSEYVKRNWL